MVSLPPMFSVALPATLTTVESGKTSAPAVTSTPLLTEVLPP